MQNTLYAGLSDLGKVRTSNEDCIGLFPDLDLYLVADGMGGHAAGEVASSLAIETVKDTLSMEEASGNPPIAPMRLEMAIKQANKKIYESGKQNPALSGMGTTIVSAFVEQGMAYIGHVGDSRGYLIRQEEITQVTSDHSLVNEYQKRGLMGPDEAERHPLKHVLSRALGTAPEVEVDVLTLPLKPGDILLLCSDGLTNTVSPQIMLHTLLRSKDNLQEACQQLIQQANSHGGIDNISVVLLQCMNNSSPAE
jgi:PPM family protein phosphatase